MPWERKDKHNKSGKAGFVDRGDVAVHLKKRKPKPV
jgi:hypothetical protein